TSWLASQREAAGHDAAALALFAQLALERTTSLWRAIGLMNLGRLWGTSGDFARAVGSAVLARDLAPEHPAPHVNLALYALCIGDWNLLHGALVALERIADSNKSAHRALRLGLFSESPAVQAVRRERHAWLLGLERKYPTLFPAESGGQLKEEGVT